MRKRPIFANGQFYHVYNRGTDRRRIFMDDKDRFRFIHDLFEFNDANIILNNTYYWGRIPIGKERKPRKILVDIVAYALMPNHYHLLLQQRRDNGISLFLQKLGSGYTGYFNLRHERSGVLFQGKYKAKHIDQDRYLRHLIFYLHLNPLDIFYKNWKEKGLHATRRIEKDLENYRWTSYLDYIGKQNFSSLLNFDVIRDFDLPIGAKEHKKQIATWLSGYPAKQEDIRALLF